MPPRRKRIRSDDSENSTVDSRGMSSGSDVQKGGKGKNLRHQSKKVDQEDYDGDCELDRYDKNRVTKTALRSRILKQRPSNAVTSDSSSSTPITHMEVDNLHGFECLVTPIPMNHHQASTPQTLPPSASEERKDDSMVPMMPKPLFETPVEKPIKKYKRKRIAKFRSSVNHAKLLTEVEAEMIQHFNEIESHELIIE